MKISRYIVAALCAAMLCACTTDDGSPTVAAKGGAGANGAGGSGGLVHVDSDRAIQVLNSGSAETGFTMPAASSFNFGSNPYTVSGHESIILDDSSASKTTNLPTGYTKLFMKPNDWNLYRADGEGGGSVVTGLRVPSGATLTITADNNYYGGKWLGAYLQFTNDIVIDGTLKTGEGFNYIYLVNAYTNSGPEKTAALPTDPALNNIVVTGTVTTSGENNGWIEFDAGRHFYNTGTLDASGADNATGSGASSDGIYIYTYTGSVYSRGIMKANGGNGGNGNGGDADEIDAYGGYLENSAVTGGSVVISGLYQANGGNAGGAAGGFGGGSGYMDFEAYGGDMLAYGRFETRGGDAKGAFKGGSPEGIDFYCYGEDYRDVGVCRISGKFDVSGGNGDTGGSAGYLYVESVGNSSGAAADVELLGFSRVDLDGGSGTYAGGGAGAYLLHTFAPYDGEVYLPAQPIVSEANVTARGGDASAKGPAPAGKRAADSIPAVRGGTGGYIELFTDYDDEEFSSITTVTQSGDIDNSGGNATNTNGSGGDSGRMDMYGYHVSTTGQLTSRGGNGDAAGGSGGLINLNSLVLRPTTYTKSNLDVKGGKGDVAGSDGYRIIDGSNIDDI